MLAAPVLGKGGKGTSGARGWGGRDLKTRLNAPSFRRHALVWYITEDPEAFTSPVYTHPIFLILMHSSPHAPAYTDTCAHLFKIHTLYPNTCTRVHTQRSYTDTPCHRNRGSAITPPPTSFPSGTRVRLHLPPLKPLCRVTAPFCTSARALTLLSSLPQCSHMTSGIVHPSVCWLRNAPLLSADGEGCRGANVLGSCSPHMPSQRWDSLHT